MSPTAKHLLSTLKTLQLMELIKNDSFPIKHFQDRKPQWWHLRDEEMKMIDACSAVSYPLLSTALEILPTKHSRKMKEDEGMKEK